MPRLDDVCAITMGQSPDSSTYNKERNGLPFFQGNADFGEIHPSVRMWCSEPSKIARENDILISVRAPIGALNIANCECCIGRGLAALTVNNDICTREYLWYALSSKIDELNSKGTGSTFKAVNKSTLSETEIPLPPLDEQRHIAATLDKVTDLISKRRQQLDKLDELVKSRFVEMFGDKDYPYKELISLIKDGAGLSYGIVQPGEDGSGNMGVLRPVDLVNGKIDTTSIKYIDRSLGEGFKKTELNGNELLISVRGTTGITALTDDRFVGMNVTRGIAVIRYDNEKINPVYLNTYLKTDESQRYIREHTRGATLQQINLSDLRVQQILVPPRDEQEQFSTFVEQTEKTKATISHSLEKLETLKKALMQEYFGTQI